MPDIPGPWEFALLVLASYRFWRLFGVDKITAPLRARCRIEPGTFWGDFCECPFCLGWWIGLLVWLAWLAGGDWTLLVLTPFAISGTLPQLERLRRL